MLLTFFCFNLLLSLTNAGASPKPDSEGLEDLVDKMESRLRDVEKRLEKLKQDWRQKIKR